MHLGERGRRTQLIELLRERCDEVCALLGLSQPTGPSAAIVAAFGTSCRTEGLRQNMRLLVQDRLAEEGMTGTVHHEAKGAFCSPFVGLLLWSGGRLS
jgi:hypothetical protein